MGRTTPPPLLDITSVFPELAPLARQAVRLHPRAGTPEEGDSSLGGPPLWPVDAPWPTCSGPRLVDRREPIAPQDLQRLRQLDAAVRERYLTAEEDAQRRRIVAGAVAIDLRTRERVYPKPQPHTDPVALVPVLQLYARDVPELPFPEQADLFQLLWCPNDHAAPWYGPRPHAVWRCAAEVTRPLSVPPALRFDEEWYEADYVPLRCVIHPERVVEYPGLRSLPGGLASHVRAKKGEDAIGPSSVDQARLGSKHHVLTDATGIPLAVLLTGGNRDDVTQLMPLLDAVPPIRGRVGRPRRKPRVLVADRGYDFDRYRRLLRARGIRPMIARRGVVHGSGLSRWRWMVERTLAWLHQYRRLRIRWERRADIHEGLLKLAVCLICWRRLHRSFS